MRKELREMLLPSNPNAHMGNMGRRDIGDKPWESVRMRDVVVPINSQGYDAGGVYWGIGKELRCSFCLVGDVVVYRKFYRKGE
jgi:hypothetical protein